MKSKFNLVIDNLDRINLLHEVDISSDATVTGTTIFSKENPPDLPDLDKFKPMTWGTLLCSPSTNTGIILTPKNASSAIRKIFVGWTTTTIQTALQQNLLPADLLFVVRDPVDRWVSGMTEWLTLWTTIEPPSRSEDKIQQLYYLLESDLFLRMLIDQGIVDMHTLPQSWFLKGLHYKNIKYFKYDSKVIFRISNYLSNSVDKIDYTKYNTYINQTNTDELKMNITLKIRELLTKYEECKLRIMDLYKCDYTLLNLIEIN
jgi:hypothetical protein